MAALPADVEVPDFRGKSHRTLGNLQHLHPGKLAVAFFGEGALNQGMLLESFNLASAWKLPVLFICKDNSLAITIDSTSVTGGKIPDRIKGFGIPVFEVDGSDVEAVWQAGFEAVKYIREGNGPYFIHARCVHDVHSIHLNLFIEFGDKRIRSTPISESAFVGAAVGAAMAGLRPVVDIMIVDFMPVAMDAIVNHAAKNKAFSGGKWNIPLVIRTACGGGYGDAGGLMLSSLEHEDPVIFFEHKLLSELWLGYMGTGGRDSVKFDVPIEGASGEVPDKWEPIPLGKACVKRKGTDMTMISLGVGVHRCLEAAASLESEGIHAGVIDLRSVSPLDKDTILEEVATSGSMLVVDEDYQHYGLSGELPAIVLEEGISFKYERVCTTQTILYSRKMEDEILPNTKRILVAAPGISLSLLNTMLQSRRRIFGKQLEWYVGEKICYFRGKQL